MVSLTGLLPNGFFFFFLHHANTFPSDDLTVQVIFFGHGEKTGEVTMNLEATNGQDIRPKL